MGAPKPLPGQMGYKMSESAILEKEAKEMELRLTSLQTKLKEDSLANPAKSSGSKWGSAKAEKGSLGSYAKEVQDKHKKKMDGYANGTLGSSLGAAARKATTQPQPLIEETFVEKDADRWNLKDVSDWLCSQGLEKYVNPFMENEINGALLKDISMEDLDYMNITILGHRKIILKGAEELRKNKRIDPNNLPAPPPNSSGHEAVAKHQKPIKTSHWSELEPLSQNAAPNKAMDINAADDGDYESGDIYDEEKEKLAFMAAVSEWRNAGKKSSSSTSDPDPSPSPKEDKSSLSDGMWSNPFAPPSADDKNGASKGGGDTKGELMAGDLDEKKEHEEFVKAVNAWRVSTKPNNQDPTSRPTSSHQLGTNTTITMDGSKNSKNSNITALLAEKLSSEMEEDQQATSRRLQSQKEEAAKRLKQASEELEKMRRNMQQEVQAKEQRSKKLDNYDYDEKEGGRGAFQAQDEEIFTKYTYNRRPADSPTKYEVDDDERQERFEIEVQNIAHSVKMSAVETALGSPLQFPTSDAYLVEECSDED